MLPVKRPFEAIVRVANMELANTEVRINIVRPGVTATEIQSKAGMTKRAGRLLFESLRATPLGRGLNSAAMSVLLCTYWVMNSIALRNAVIEVEGGYLL